MVSVGLGLDAGQACHRHGVARVEFQRGLEKLARGIDHLQVVPMFNQGLSAQIGLIRRHDFGWRTSQRVAIDMGRVWVELGQGNYSKAVDYLDRSLGDGSATSLTLAIRASIQSATNNTAEALQLMDQAMAMGFGDLAWINGNADFEALRQSPEFNELLEKHGLGKLDD